MSIAAAREDNFQTPDPSCPPCPPIFDQVRDVRPVVQQPSAVLSHGDGLIADPTQIDTIEYCFLEGQAGVYFETRQGFEVDGIEMKARMDFAAAAIDYRGLQKNAGQ